MANAVVAQVDKLAKVVANCHDFMPPSFEYTPSRAIAKACNDTLAAICQILNAARDNPAASPDIFPDSHVAIMMMSMTLDEQPYYRHADELFHSHLMAHADYIAETFAKTLCPKKTSEAIDRIVQNQFAGELAPLQFILDHVHLIVDPLIQTRICNEALSLLHLLAQSEETSLRLTVH